VVAVAQAVRVARVALAERQGPTALRAPVVYEMVDSAEAMAV
jgi:hypothetical protein